MSEMKISGWEEAATLTRAAHQVWGGAQNGAFAFRPNSPAALHNEGVLGSGCKVPALASWQLPSGAKVSLTTGERMTLSPLPGHL